MMSSILECIRTVGRGERGKKPLNFDQAYKVMDEYLDGKIGDDQMAMLMMLIRVQNETKEEIAGFVKAFQSRVPNLGAEIDWPCYAGKREAAGQPWHLLAAKILADNGHKVLLHGFSEPDSGRLHAEHYLDVVGVKRAKSIEEASTLLNEHNVAYLALETFAPQARSMIAWKARYGLRTPINTVVRALNPGGAEIGVRGSFHPGFQQLHADVEQEIGLTSHAVISYKGVSGESEYNPKVSQTVWLSHKEGVDSHYWPELYDSELVLPTFCPFATASEDQVLMANTVVASIAAVLFARNQDRQKSIELATSWWRTYCS
ncbi:glycosyl transferase family protein [Vibrio sp. RC27]